VASRNRAVVDELIRLMNTRDERPTHLVHPDIEWHWAASIPGPSLYRGRAELVKGLDTWAESWDELVVEPVEFLENGDYVLALTQYFRLARKPGEALGRLGVLLARVLVLGRGLGHERGLQALLDRLLGHDALLHVAP
jgi:hypothetical protein